MTVDLTPRERILFVCTANIDRSRTAEDMYREDARYEVRSAGVAPFATVVLTRDLLLWADRVFVMSEREDQHRTLIRMCSEDCGEGHKDMTGSLVVRARSKSR